MTPVSRADEPQASGPPIAFQAEDGEHSPPAPAPAERSAPALGYQAEDGERFSAW